jgi:hypothetical protein
MYEQTILNEKKFPNLSCLAESKLIEMVEQGDTESINFASNYTGLLSFPLLKELMIKNYLQTRLRFNLMEMKRNKFIKSWSKPIFKDANKYIYKNFGNIPTSFFISIGNSGLRFKDNYNFLMNFEKNKISSQKRIQYLGFYTDNNKNKFGYYQVNYTFLIGIYEFGKHVKNILLIYKDKDEYNVNDSSHRFNILSINNWFFLEEELCKCFGGEDV